MTPEIAVGLIGSETSEMAIINIIEKIVAAVNDIPASYLKIKLREKDCCRPRQMSITFITMFTKINYRTITELYNLSRTSYYRCIETVQKDYETNKAYKARFDYIQKQIRDILIDKELFIKMKPLNEIYIKRCKTSN